MNRHTYVCIYMPVCMLTLVGMLSVYLSIKYQTYTSKKMCDTEISLESSAYRCVCVWM